MVFPDFISQLLVSLWLVKREREREMWFQVGISKKPAIACERYAVQPSSSELGLSEHLAFPNSSSWSCTFVHYTLIGNLDYLSTQVSERFFLVPAHSDNWNCTMLFFPVLGRGVILWIRVFRCELHGIDMGTISLTGKNFRPIIIIKLHIENL